MVFNRKLLSRSVVVLSLLTLIVVNVGCGGVTSASSTPQTPTISISVTPTSATVQPGGTQQFTATVTGSNNTGVNWTASNGSISNSGLYTAPNTTGSYTITATSLADSTKSASATITVSQTPTQLLSVSPSSISFGNILVGNTATQSVTLRNTGTSSVTVSAANFTGGVFSASGMSLPLTIAAGGSRTITINFLPDISGPFSGSVSFVSNATDSPTSVQLSGTGVAAVAHSVDLSWNGSTSTSVSGYYVYRSTTSGGGYSKLNSTPASSTTYTDPAVSSGVTYYYVVTATDSNGNESVYSNEARAAIPIP